MMEEPENLSPELLDVSFEPPEIVDGEVIPVDFEQRVQRLMGMIETDSTVRDRMLCEIYIGFSDMDRAMRTVALNGGPFKMLRAMMGKGGKEDS